MEYTYNAPEIRPKCGEIWMCDLPFREGGVQYGKRPVFVLSNDLNNTYSQIVNIIPITSKRKANHLPIHIGLNKYSVYGLSMYGTLLIEQITTIPMEYLMWKIGEIKDDDILLKIGEAIKIQFPVLS